MASEKRTQRQRLAAWEAGRLPTCPAPQPLEEPATAPQSRPPLARVPGELVLLPQRDADVLPAREAVPVREPPDELEDVPDELDRLFAENRRYRRALARRSRRRRLPTPRIVDGTGEHE